MDEVTYEVDGHVATITLNRPDKLNAMTDEMYHGIGEALLASDADPAVRCTVVTRNRPGVHLRPRSRRVRGPDCVDAVAP